MDESSDQDTGIGRDLSGRVAVRISLPDLHKRSGVVTGQQKILPPSGKGCEPPRKTKEGQVMAQVMTLPTRMIDT